MCKLPFAHRDLNSYRFLFGDDICAYALALESALSPLAFVLVCGYLANAWLRVRRTNNHLWSHPSFPPSAGYVLKEVALLVGFGLALTATVAATVTYRY